MSFYVSTTISMLLALLCGLFHGDKFYVTESGTPQGGIIVPLLANIALHGMDKALNIKYKKYKKSDGTYTYKNLSKYVVVRYADDFVRQDGSLSSF